MRVDYSGTHCTKYSQTLTYSLVKEFLYIIKQLGNKTNNEQLLMNKDPLN